MFLNNRKKYFEKVEKNSISLFYSGKSFPRTADQDFDFEVDKNFFYLTGISQENVILMLLKEENNQKAILFIEENDPVLVKWVGKKLEKAEATAISGITDVMYISQFERMLFLHLNPSRVAFAQFDKLYLNLERRNDPSYTNWALKFAQDIKVKYPEIQILNSYNIVIGLRMFKCQEEVDRIQASIDVTKTGIESLMLNSKPGMYEYQLENYFDFHLKQNNQRTVSFKTICASGINATILHYVDNNAILNDNELILFDLGCRANDYYISDISRTFPINGKFTARQKDVYEAVLNVNKKCIEFLKPGITWVEFNKYATNLLAEACINLGLITDKKDITKYYWHSIGHNIGLDTHDPSLPHIPLSEGMVITVEPGLYIEEEKIGVRIEDNVLITKDGAKNLSVDIIKEVADIEKFMAK